MPFGYAGASVDVEHTLHFSQQALDVNADHGVFTKNYLEAWAHNELPRRRVQMCEGQFFLYIRCHISYNSRRLEQADPVSH